MMVEKIGSVVVIGGGIAGIQASLDLAEQGFKVYLMDSNPSIGGRMVQLDKTFPTLDCAMCILGPKLVDVQRHPNIELLTYCDPLGLEGDAGNFTLHYRKKARFVDESKCTGCGVCEEKCPVWVDDEFNAFITQQDKRGRSKPVRKNVSIPFPQAVPKIAYIQREKCIYLTKGKCRLCEKNCGPGAIDFDQKDEELDLHVGAVIVATGFDPFDPKPEKALRFGEYENVVTTLQFERFLNASGPTGGAVIRPSDQKHPQTIAFLQCIGSRNPSLGRDYCSAACCMYAVKEAIMAREHDPDVEVLIFYMDIRAFGKGFEEFYRRAKDEFGIRFIKSRIAEVRQNHENKNLVLKYEDYESDNPVATVEVEMVVLSTGLDPTSRRTFLESTLHLELDKYGFVETGPLTPLETNVPGMYVCGVASGPKDIPDTVAEGSAAASKASILLREVKGTQISQVKEVRPIEVSVADEPRIGVFVCHCGHNIGAVVDCAAVADYAKQFPTVVYSTDPMYACSADSQVLIKEKIAEHNLNRIIVASCTPRTHEPLFRSTLREVGLNEFLFELTNLREHVSWVHPQDKPKATEKAKDLVRGAIVRACQLGPLFKEQIPIVQKVLVVGGGVAGMTSALDVARAGYDVFLVEKESEMGGELLKNKKLHNGLEGPAVVQDLVSQISELQNITVFLDAEISSLRGAVGNYFGVINGQEVSFGAVILATGAEPFIPEGYYRYGELDKVLTQREFEDQLDEDLVPQSVVMIQCVGSREDDPPRTYCSRICCTVAIKNAIAVKEQKPNAQIIVLYKDIRTYGTLEELYNQARQLGVIFIRFVDDDPPTISAEGVVEVNDPMIGGRLRINPDVVVLSVPLVPKPNEDLAQLFKVTRGADNFFLEAHVKLRPLDFATDGIFLAGTAHYPKLATESITQASGAAVRAMALLSKGYLLSEGAISEVQEDLCRGCGRCADVCPYKAIDLVPKEVRLETETLQTVHAFVNPGVCKGCGSCVVTCPVGAIQIHHFPNKIVEDQVKAILTPQLVSLTEEGVQIQVE